MVATAARQIRPDHMVEVRIGGKWVLAYSADWSDSALVGSMRRVCERDLEPVYESDEGRAERECEERMLYGCAN